MDTEHSAASPHEPTPAARDWLKPGVLLGLFALIFIFLLAFTYEQTGERIAAQQQLRLQAQLEELLTYSRYDNDPAADALLIEPGKRIVYRARQQGQGVAALFKTVTEAGYNGSIHLLVGVDATGRLLGVRALAHRETPGLGDEIDLRRSDWILNFNRRSLDDPPLEDWAVKKDGGVFDAFTGATITPRAVIEEVARTLVYFDNHQHEIFQ